MLPIGPLMIEHRLIEKMIEVIRAETRSVAEGKRIEESFVDSAVDFIHTYADRTHHGKEEAILFRDLAKKDLAEEDRRIMQELVDEHAHTREVVRELIEAKIQYFSGQTSALRTMLDRFEILIGLYPVHIKKEDRVFFPAAMKYIYNKEERDAMLEEMWRFDREMIHEKYRQVVSHLGGTA